MLLNVEDKTEKRTAKRSLPPPAPISIAIKRRNTAGSWSLAPPAVVFLRNCRPLTPAWCCGTSAFVTLATDLTDVRGKGLNGLWARGCGFAEVNAEAQRTALRRVLFCNIPRNVTYCHRSYQTGQVFPPYLIGRVGRCPLCAEAWCRHVEASGDLRSWVSRSAWHRAPDPLDLKQHGCINPAILPE